LIARIKEGRPELFELLMRRHNRRVYRVIRSILRDEAEVEDVMQEAYLNAFTHLQDFAGEARFSTWLTRIAIHGAFARIRKRRLFESIDDDAGEHLEMASSGPSPEQGASDTELRGILEQAVDALPES